MDRAMSVLFPMKSRRFCHRNVAYTITLLLVIILTVFNSHFFYGFVVLSAKSTSNERILICHHRIDSDTYRRFFSVYDSYVDVIKTNVIPFIIMSICNIIIIVRVCRSNPSPDANGHNRCRKPKSKRKHEKDRQLTLMLLSSAIAFLFLTLPTEINDIIRSHSREKLVNEKTYLLSAILLSLAHLNYAVRTRSFGRWRPSTGHGPRLRLGPFLHLHADWRSLSSTTSEALANRSRLALAGGVRSM
jgi:hypothetical protein